MDFNLQIFPNFIFTKFINYFTFFNQQRQDSSSERVRRLQSDKDALQLQVQILTEQINAQNDKLKEMEMVMNEKNLQISNTEDLLNRVRNSGMLQGFAKLIKLNNFRKCSHDHHWRPRN